MERLSGPQVSPGRQRFKEAILQNHRLRLAVVPEVGCHWTGLQASVKGHWLDLLVPVANLDALANKPGGQGSFLMAPWSNRLAGGAFTFAGEQHRLRVNAPDGTAIHGDVRSRPWQVVATSGERLEARLDTRDFPDFNYPFALRLQQTLEISGDRLRVELSIENVDRRRAPVGFGFHPYLKRRLTPADQDVILVVPAERVYPAVGCIPTGPPEPVARATDLTRLGFLGAPNLDHCFTSLTAGEIRAIYPGSGVEVRFHLDSAFTHAVIYAPNATDGSPRDFVAVEPVTNANNGFNLLDLGWPMTGVKVLEPGEAWGGGWEISVGDVGEARR